MDKIWDVGQEEVIEKINASYKLESSIVASM